MGAHKSIEIEGLRRKERTTRAILGFDDFRPLDAKACIARVQCGLDCQTTELKSPCEEETTIQRRQERVSERCVRWSRDPGLVSCRPLRWNQTSWVRQSKLNCRMESRRRGVPGVGRDLGCQWSCQSCCWAERPSLANYWRCCCQRCRRLHKPQKMVRNVDT